MPKPKLTKLERKVLLAKVAGSVAAGLANADCLAKSGGGIDHSRERRDVARASVQVAERIMVEVGL